MDSEDSGDREEGGGGKIGLMNERDEGGRCEGIVETEETTASCSR